MFDFFEKAPFLKNIAKSRWLQFIIVFPTLLFFYVFLIAGIFGTASGMRNIIVIFVWILWWILLIGLMVPFFSRIWCLICPFPIIGEWLQRMSFIKVRTGNNVPGLGNQYFGCNKAWPQKGRHIWLQNFGFLCLAMFSPFLVTRPFVSVAVLGGLVIIATVLALIYKQRVFCSYICPVSGFLGLYALTSNLGVRAKDVELCNRIKKGKEEDFNFDQGIAGCRLNCPTGMDASSYIALIDKGMYKEALEIMREATPFVGVLGRTCTHPCEEECLRGKVDEPISICRLKRFVTDHVGDEYVPNEKFKPLHKDKIAVIGAGPVGLSCAYHLARKGYEATVYESSQVIGGMLRVGIPNFHLPKDVVDKEIEFIKKTGVKIISNTAIGKDISFEELRKQYQAVFVAVGASKAKRLKVEGEDMEGVHLGIDFLRRVNMGEDVKVGDRVVIIGGGKTAEDVARSALRLGAKEAISIEIRAEEDLSPVNEVTKAEGVKVLYSTCPTKIIGDKGKVTYVRCVKMRKGEIDETSGVPRMVPAVKGSEHLIPADTVIIATGQYSDISFLPKELDISPSGTLVVDPDTLSTNIAGIFAGGDVATGPAVLVKGLGAGRKAAISIDNHLRKGKLKPVSLYPTEKRVEDEPILSGILHEEERVEPHFLPVKERLKNFEEVEQPFTENMAREEAERCLNCGICGECYRGSEKGWSCAWFQKMGGMDRNNYCGLCMECVKSCPHDNIRPYWRSFATDNAIRGYDEAWKAFIMMVLAIIYPINLLSPWGKIKDWLNFTETGMIGHFILLAANMLLWCLVLFPAIHYLFCKWSKALSGVKEIEVKKLFRKYAFAYVPFGLTAWICFSVPLMLVSTTYIVPVLSDPFGWGWNLFGTAHAHWSPIFPYWVPYIQASLLLIGLFYSINSIFDIAKRTFEKKDEAFRSIIPITVLLLLIIMVLFKIYLG